jgi:hypothetical protein
VALFGRQSKPWLPLVSLERGERVLVAREATSGWVVATTRALWLPDRAGLSRVGWESVGGASWDQDSSVLLVRESGAVGSRPRTWSVRMDDHRDLLLLIKEQVRATIVASRRVPVDAKRGVTLVARRPPGSTGLTWEVSVDPGVDVGDEDVRALVESRLQELKAELGPGA